MGFQQTAIRFRRDPALWGSQITRLSKSLALAVNGTVSFSKSFASTYVGLLASAAILMGLLVLYWRIFCAAFAFDRV